MTNDPVYTTLQLLGGKWKLLIIRELLKEPKRFSQLFHSLEGIHQKVLSDTLKEMQEDGLIVLENEQYQLSEIGWSMEPILDTMNDWGKAYINQQKNR